MDALCEVVSIIIGDTEKRSPASIRYIRKFCSSLVRQSNDGNHLEAAHFTVKEFLNSINPELHPTIARFYLTKETAFLEMSQMCLTYLNFESFIIPIPHSEHECCRILKENQFLEHCVNLWYKYAKNHWGNDTLFRLGKQFFNPTISSNFKVWRRFYIRQVNNPERLMERIRDMEDSTLHWAAILHVPELVEWLLTKGVEIDLHGPLGSPIASALFMPPNLSYEDIEYPPFNIQDLIYCVPSSWNSSPSRRCIELLVKHGASWENIASIDTFDTEVSLQELLLYAADPSIFEILQFRESFFDRKIAARIKKVVTEASEVHEEKWKKDFICALSSLPELSVVEGFENGLTELLQKLNGTFDYAEGQELIVKICEAAKHNQADLLSPLLSGEKVGNIDEILEWDDESDDEVTDEEEEDIVKDLEPDDESNNEVTDEEEEDIDEDSELDDEMDSEIADDEIGMNALHCAIVAGSASCIQILLDAGASVTVKTGFGSSALHLAVRSIKPRAWDCICLLLISGAEVNQLDNEQRTPLHDSVDYAHRIITTTLLDHGANALLADSNGQTPYHIAVLAGKLEIFQVLLKHARGGLSGLYYRDSDGLTPTRLAIQENKRSFIVEILENIDIETLLLEEDTDFLHFAATNGTEDLLQIILNSNIESERVFRKKPNGETILHALAQNENYVWKFMAKFVDQGLSFLDKRDDGCRPLHLLLAGTQPVQLEKLEFMVAEDPNALDHNGISYLTHLSRSKRPAPEHKQVAIALIKCGVDPLIKNEAGKCWLESLLSEDLQFAIELAYGIRSHGFEGFRDDDTERVTCISELYDAIKVFDRI
jgi:ankyrin repeat protein